MGERRGAGLAERAYRRLVRWLLARAPSRGAREDAEDEIVGLFREARELARQRERSAVTFWLRMLADAATLAVLELRGARASGAGRWPHGGKPHTRNDGRMGMEQIMKDFRFAIRQLVRRPGFALVLIVTLALGIGANTAVFSVVHTVLLRPLPFPEQERLAIVWTQFPSLELLEFPASVPEYLDYRDQSRSFEHLAAFASSARTITGDGEPERVRIAFATWQLFPVLGVDPLLGRVITEQDDQPDADEVAVVGHALWQQRFGGDPGIVGRSVLLDGVPTTVIGVMPGEFRFPTPETQVWLPSGLDPANPGGRASHGVNMIGRLRPGVTLAAARTELDALLARWQADETLDHTWNAEFHPAFLRPLREQAVGDVTRPLLVVLAAVAVVLLIACANVANLLLVRGEGRSRELSVRTAMGAGRGRIASQLLTESVVMALVGGLVGLALAWLGVGALRRLAPPDLPRLDEIGVHPVVLLFSLGVTVLAGILFGLAPALQAGRIDVQVALREEGRSGMVGSGRVRLRQLLVVSQTAMAVVLLVAAGLLLRSFHRLQAVDPGFRTDGVVALSLNVAASSYADGPEVAAFYRDLLPRIEALPGVVSVGAVRTAPLGGPLPPNDVEVEGYVDETDGPPLNADIQTVTPGYFETLGITLLQGRDFTAADGPDAPLVAVASEELAERFWPGESALGERIRQPGFTEWVEVVGVVRDVHHEGLDRPMRGTLYFAHAQGPRTWFPVRAMTLTVRTALEPAAVVSAVRNEVRAMDPDVPLYQVQTLERALADSTATLRFTMLLQLLFAALALTLAAVGIYGVMAFTVARRAPEIGLRMALGAERSDVVRMVVGKAMTIVGIALVVGVAGALAAGQVLSSLLFGVSPRDPATYALVVGSLVAVALLACWIPARRASRVDPASALRHD